jgi:hypothetical protein
MLQRPEWFICEQCGHVMLRDDREVRTRPHIASKAFNPRREDGVIIGRLHISPPARSGRRSLVQARTGGWYDDDTSPKLLDMRQIYFFGRLRSRQKWLCNPRSVLCRKSRAGKGTVPIEHSREGSLEKRAFPSKHATKGTTLGERSRPRHRRVRSHLGCNPCPSGRTIRLIRSNANTVFSHAASSIQ